MKIKSATILVSLLAAALHAGDPIIPEPVSVNATKTVPVIDGKANDACWKKSPWQAIDQAWVPYGQKTTRQDFSGHYKVTWSPQTNLLYFLVEIRDDVFVDGYLPGKTSDIYNYDIIEVFIDEDASGGLHVFDGVDSVAAEFGANAENAFAYHIYAPFPRIKQTTNHCLVGDLVGSDWSNAKSVDYASHLPEFCLRRSGQTAVWEFSLLVYNDAYQDSCRASARTLLQNGREMGLSLAYCDNDGADEQPKTRDSFYGSVYVPPAAANEHWKNADYFGKIKLNIKDAGHETF
jgi:hypothetical protein